MSRAQRGWHEGFCIDHTPLYNEPSVTAHCSWCFEETSHTIQNDCLLNRMTFQGTVFACDSCHRATQHCKKCDAMCRISERGSTPLCFACCDLVSWDDPQAARDSVTIHGWCPWCVNQTEQTLKVHFKSTNNTSGDIFQCSQCSQEIKPCPCKRSSIIASSKKSKCKPCQESRGERMWQDIQTKFTQLCNSYSLELGKQEMQRKSKYQEKALNAGLIRPFLLLVSMDPRMRSATAFKLDIPLLHYEILGNAHAEADLILFEPKKGLQRRTNSIFESVGVSTKCNWYQILRRAIHDLSDAESSLKSKTAKETFGECANPSSKVLHTLEMELLDHMAKRHVQMLNPELRQKAIELYEKDEIYHMFDELHEEGCQIHSICIMFIAIAISSGMQSGKLNMDINQIHYNEFLEYLRSYLGGTNAVGDKVHSAQFAGTQVVFFIARVIVVGSIVNLVGTVLFPPFLPFVSAGLFCVGVALFVAAFIYRPSREISCQATLLIVFQQFLLATSKMDLPVSPRSRVAK
mmetsp:Transcript_12450/g.15519  ORF Transcript_12450/g.15519 Transcript_12450/m.15519 type:complete len:519 (+) Transcript_12450:226-1782(+)